MDEPIVKWILAVVVALLIWRVVIKTGFLPLGFAMRLYGESVGVLFRNGWIVWLYLAGYLAAAVITEPGRIMVESAWRQQWETQMGMAAGWSISWDSYLVQSSIVRALPTTNGWVWSSPFGVVSIWVPVILLIVYRRQVLPEVLPADRFSKKVLRWLRLLLWAGVISACGNVAYQVTALFNLRAASQEDTYTIQVLSVLALPLSAFALAIDTYLRCGLLKAAQQSNAVQPTHARQLLSVSSDDFWRLIKFSLLAALVLEVLPMLTLLILKAVPLFFKVNSPSWMHSAFEYFHAGLYVVGLAVFPSVLFIVLERCEWRRALNETISLWRRHYRAWLALLLPLLVLGFGINLGTRLLPFYVHWWMGRICVPILTDLIGVLIGAFWLMTVVRWWNQTQPAVSEPRPEVVSGP
jgi:hypothetical protein